jgi:hypothetical protein
MDQRCRVARLAACPVSFLLLDPAVTFVRFYLVGYFLLFFGALFALWQSGALSRIPQSWLVLAALVAIGLGVLLALASGPRKVTASRE